MMATWTGRVLVACLRRRPGCVRTIVEGIKPFVVRLGVKSFMAVCFCRAWLAYEYSSECRGKIMSCHLISNSLKIVIFVVRFKREKNKRRFGRDYESDTIRRARYGYEVDKETRSGRGWRGRAVCAEVRRVGGVAGPWAPSGCQGDTWGE
ncbi:hypothetical protein YC2023_037091 [Brassica napus]